MGHIPRAFDSPRFLLVYGREEFVVAAYFRFDVNPKTKTIVRFRDSHLQVPFCISNGMHVTSNCFSSGCDLSQLIGAAAAVILVITASVWQNAVVLFFRDSRCRIERPTNPLLWFVSLVHRDGCSVKSGKIRMDRRGAN